MTRTVRIGNICGFYGDRPGAAAEMPGGEIDFYRDSRLFGIGAGADEVMLDLLSRIELDPDG